MKRLLQILCLPLLLVTQGVYGDIDSGIFGSEKMAEPEKESQRPFSVYFSYDNVCNSNFSNNEFKGESQSYSEAEVEVGSVFYYNSCYEEGGRATVGYTYADFQWNQNPYFRQNRFNVTSFELGFATKRLTNWLWQANVSMNIDANHFNVSKYANYDLLLWGRYSMRPNIGYHVGFLAFAGMHVNKIWPIIGFDWVINKKWKLNAVYPLNVSLVYQFNRCFSASLAGRAFINRYRVGKDEPVPEAIFEYRNTGAEFALNYEWCSRLKVNLHVGHTLGGQIRISDKNYFHTRHLDIDGACYFGGNLDYSF